MKKYVGKLISLKFEDRKDAVYGFVIDYNEQWTLMRHNVVDYVLDGYIILAHKKVKGWRRSEEEKFREKVIKLKGYGTEMERGVPLTSLESILGTLSKRYGVFQFTTKDESVCYLGRLISVDEKKLTINFLDSKARWTGKRTFKVKDIRSIEFDTDYINSLKLIATKQAPRKKGVDVKSFVGKLTLESDPLVIQKRMRDGWK